MTTDSKVRIHSCEKGTDCPVLNKAGSSQSSGIVWITPIITHASNGDIVPELGAAAGGGGGDLHQSHNLELNDPADILKLMQLCSDKIMDKDARARALQVISDAASSPEKTINLTDFGVKEIEDDFSIEQLPELLASLSENKRLASEKGNWQDTDKPIVNKSSHREPLLPRRIVSILFYISLREVQINVFPSISLTLDIPPLTSFVLS